MLAGKTLCLQSNAICGKKRLPRPGFGLFFDRRADDNLSVGALFLSAAPLFCPADGTRPQDKREERRTQTAQMAIIFSNSPPCGKERFQTQMPRRAQFFAEAAKICGICGRLSILKYSCHTYYSVT